MPTIEDTISQEEIDALLGHNYITSNSDIQKFKKHNDIKKSSGIGHIDYKKGNGKRNIISEKFLESKIQEVPKEPAKTKSSTGFDIDYGDHDLEKSSTDRQRYKKEQVNDFKSSTGFDIDYGDHDLEKTSLDRQRYEKEQVDDFNAKRRKKEQEEWKAKDRANNKWAEDIGITTHSTGDIANNPGRLYKQFIDDFNKDGAQKIGAIAERDYAGHFNKDLSVTNKRKEQLLSRRWKKTLEEVTPDASRETYKQEKMAMEKFSKDYNLDIDLSDYKTSTMGRIANRIRGNKNISRDEAIQRMHDSYMSKTDEYLKSLKEQHEAGKLTDRQHLRRANVGYTKRAAAIERGEAKAASKNLSKLGWKGKAGAAAALLALGGVIGNQFSGGHQSNAQLYNPNPQPQYAN